MKKFSKILSVALLVALVLSLGVANAFAADPQAVGNATAKITAPAAGENETVHTYEVYQIFAGDLATKDGVKVLSNVIWGTNSKPATGGAVGGAVAQSVLDELATATGNDKAKLAVITKYVDLTTDPIAEVTDGNNITVPTGYYLLKDKDNTVPDDEALTQYIVQVVGDTTITRKADQPTSEKKVKDINDSKDSAYTDWQDGADYDIGDVISYQLTATIPETVRLSDFSKYELKFVDTISKGLTYNTGSASIKVNNTQVATNDPTPDDYSGNDAAYANGKVLTWDLGDIMKTPYNVNTQGTKYVITIDYTVTLNSNAVYGSAGNPNKMHIEFSRNPNDTTDKGETPDDINIVFTFKTVFNKVDGDKKPLTGADFQLFKFVLSASGTETYKELTGNWVNVEELHGTGEGTINPSKTKETYTKNSDSATNAKFTFAGLDDGYYKLHESVTPAGYNTIADIEFEITATHDIVSANPSLTALTGTNGAEFTMTAVESEGSLTTEIQNNSGAVLPSTGGIGTTIFYVVGGVLVLAAIILLVTKKRMSE